MNSVMKLADCMQEDVKAYILNKIDDIREIRIRAGRPIQIISDEDKLIGNNLSARLISDIINMYTDYSLYTREEELRSGYFTLRDGSRVGVCGRVTVENGKITNLANISSLSLRVAREIKGCAAGLIDKIVIGETISSTLVFSAPGLGKTTLLRDIARMLSDAGRRIAIVDERHEISACLQGIPTMDVGQRTDVLDGCPKYLAISQLIRTMSPQVIITDEIGDVRDAQAILDAVRCGVTVIASAHASDFEDLSQRSSIKKLLSNGVFSLVIRLEGKAGEISAIKKCSLNQGGDGLIWECV